MSTRLCEATGGGEARASAALPATSHPSSGIRARSGADALGRTAGNLELVTPVPADERLGLRAGLFQRADHLARELLARHMPL